MQYGCGRRNLQYGCSIDTGVRIYSTGHRRWEAAIPGCVCSEPDGLIVTSVHRKPTHTNQSLPFDSHHPVAHKEDVDEQIQ